MDTHGVPLIAAVISASNGKKLLGLDLIIPQVRSCHTWDDYTYYICPGPCLQLIVHLGPEGDL